MTSSINTQFFDNAVAQINAIGDCAELTQEAHKAADYLLKKEAALQQVMADLAPFLELIENPAAELPKIAAWISKFISASIGPKVAAYEQAVQDISALAQQTERVIAAIQAAENRITSCAVSLPASLTTGSNGQSVL